MKKYLLVPGYVYSQHDGEAHLIGPYDLARLYNVPMIECIIHSMEMKLYPESYPDLIILHPKSDGDYTLPKGVDNESA